MREKGVILNVTLCLNFLGTKVETTNVTTYCTMARCNR